MSNGKSSAVSDTFLRPAFTQVVGNCLGLARLDYFRLSVVPAAWCLVLFAFAPFFSGLQMAGDEQIQIGVASVLQQGKLPYRDFWYDHPPGLPLVYCGLFEIFGTRPGVARCLSLFASFTILLSLGCIALRLHSLKAAIASQLLLISQPMYV